MEEKKEIKEDTKNKTRNTNIISRNENRNEKRYENTNNESSSDNNFIVKNSLTLYDNILFNISNDDDKGEEELKKEKEKEEEKEKEKEKEEKEEEDFSLKERMRKSRGLRKLLVKKAKEKKEALKKNFFKFYRAGIIQKFRQQGRRRSCVINKPVITNLVKRILTKDIDNNDDINNSNNSNNHSSKKLLSKELKEQKDLKEKTQKILEKIIYKKDRKTMVILKEHFQKFLLKAKLASVTNILDYDKNNRRKRKKMKKKRKKLNTEEENEKNNKIEDNMHEEGN